MILTYLRSSSYNQYDFCQQAFLMRYVLGFPDVGNKKADKGNIVHKALELMAMKKLAIQNGEAAVADAESGRRWPVDALTPEQAIDTAWDVYTKIRPTPHAWERRDFADCKRWMYDAFAYNGGLFDPMKRTVIWPEKYFDFVIEDERFAYAYVLPDGQRATGYLGLKGTVDLVCEVDHMPGVVEMVDWKTGMRKDWATGKPKDYDKLMQDPQLRMYHYALNRLLPDADQIYVTIVFIQDGGPFPLPFTKADLPETEAIIAKRFNEIRDNVRPKLIINDPVHKWKCSKLCHFGKNNFVDESGKDAGKTMCQHIADEVVQLGMDRVTAKYGKSLSFMNYGAGGGVADREKKDGV